MLFSNICFCLDSRNAIREGLLCMAKNIDVKPTDWQGESEVWEKLGSNLPKNYLIYNHRTVKGQEFDFCVVAENLCVFIVEVKGWTAAKIFDVVSNDQIVIENYPKQKSPLKQAVMYRNNLVEVLRDDLQLNTYVTEFVCYPFITEEEYRAKKLNYVSESVSTIFKEDLNDSVKLTEKFVNKFKSKHSTLPPLDSKGVAKLRHYFEPNYDLKEENEELLKPYSKLYVFHSHLTVEVENQIIDEYFSGVKVQLFVGEFEQLKEFKENLDDRFQKYNLSYGHGSVFLGKNTEKPSEIVNNSFELFNLSAFFIPEIDQIADHDIVITEGKIDSAQLAVLHSLSERSNFNVDQYLIEHSDKEKNILVMAGAGTGKTYSMVSRIAYLCNCSDSKIHSIVDDIAMMTFTNDAADNMKNRIKKLFMNYFILTSDSKYLRRIEDISKLQISTIHKFSIGILRNACLHQGIGFDFDITSEIYNRRKIYSDYLNNYLDQKNIENPDFIYQIGMPVYKLRDVLMEFSDKLKNRNVDISEIKEEMLGESPIEIPYFNELIMQVIIPSEIQYSENLRISNRLDLRDCMIKLESLLKITPVLDHNFSYKYLFVDEFQDTDDVQIRIICALQKSFGPQCHLFVVGDLKQSIYRFRGATLSAFSKIRAGEGDWISFHLNRNYRTDSRLLEEYDKIFTKMNSMGLLPYRGEDKLSSSINKQYPEDKLIERIEVHQKDLNGFYDEIFKTISVQKDYISKYAIAKKLSDEDSTIALLVRENRQVESIVAEGKKRKIFIDVSNGGDLYQQQPSLDLYKLTMALTHSKSPVYLTNLLMSNYVNAGKQVFPIVNMNISDKCEMLTEMLDQFFISRMHITWKQLIERFQTYPALAVLREVYFSTQPWAQFDYLNNARQINYRENYECLIEDIQSHFRRDFLTINMINKYLEIEITTYQSEKSRESGTSRESVRVICTTIHKSKGLEYGTVILPFTNADIAKEKNAGINAYLEGNHLAYSIKAEKNVSGSNSYFESDNELQEQKREESRILYVAMTRAIRNLIWFDDLDRKPVLSWSTLLGKDDERVCQ